MLVVPRDLLDEVRAHAAAAYPLECCGLLLGLGGPERAAVSATWRCRNLDTERGADRYLLDPADRLAGERFADEQGLVLVGFYHSHPDHDAYFSATDLARSEEVGWGEPWVPSTYAYLVVSVRSGRALDARAFRVVEGRSEERPLEVE